MRLSASPLTLEGLTAVADITAVLTAVADITAAVEEAVVGAFVGCFDN